MPASPSCLTATLLDRWQVVAVVIVVVFYGIILLWQYMQP